MHLKHVTPLNSPVTDGVHQATYQKQPTTPLWKLIEVRLGHKVNIKY